VVGSRSKRPPPSRLATASPPATQGAAALRPAMSPPALAAPLPAAAAPVPSDAENDVEAMVVAAVPNDVLRLAATEGAADSAPAVTAALVAELKPDSALSHPPLAAMRAPIESPPIMPTKLA